MCSCYHDTLPGKASLKPSSEPLVTIKVASIAWVINRWHVQRMKQSHRLCCHERGNPHCCNHWGGRSIWAISIAIEEIGCSWFMSHCLCRWTEFGVAIIRVIHNGCPCCRDNSNCNLQWNKLQLYHHHITDIQYVYNAVRCIHKYKYTHTHVHTVLLVSSIHSVKRIVGEYLGVRLLHEHSSYTSSLYSYRWLREVDCISV